MSLQCFFVCLFLKPSLLSDLPNYIEYFNSINKGRCFSKSTSVFIAVHFRICNPIHSIGAYIVQEVMATWNLSEESQGESESAQCPCNAKSLTGRKN